MSPDFAPLIGPFTIASGYGLVVGVADVATGTNGTYCCTGGCVGCVYVIGYPSFWNDPETDAEADA